MNRLFPPILLLFFLSTTACSVILRHEELKAEVANTNWKIEKTDNYQYPKFEQGNISLDVRPSFGPSRRIMWFGPPLIPIIPKFLYTQPPQTDYAIHFTVSLESLNDTTFIDLSQVKGLTSSGKELQPSSIRVYVKPAGSSAFSTATVNQQVLLVKQEMTCYLIFTVAATKVEGFILDMGKLSINDITIKLSPLKFQKTKRYSYFPFVLADHIADY